MSERDTAQPTLESRISTGIDALPEGFEIPSLANPGLSSEDEVESADETETDTETQEGGADDDSSASESTESTTVSEATDDQTPDTDTPSESADVSSLASIAESEREIRQARIQLRNRETQIAEREKALEDAPKPVDISEAIRKNPFQALKDAGMPFDHLLDVVSRNQGEIPNVTETPQTSSEVTELKEMITRLEQKIENKEADEKADKSKDEYKEVVSITVKDAKYAVLRTMPGCEDAIFDLALKHAQRTGEALPPTVIADSLQERWAKTLKGVTGNNDARKVMGLDPIADGEKPKPPPSKRENPVESQSTETTTLTQETSQVTRPKKSTKGMSREESILQAAKQLKKEDVWGSLDEEEDDEDI